MRPHCDEGWGQEFLWWICFACCLLSRWLFYFSLFHWSCKSVDIKCFFDSPCGFVWKTTSWESQNLFRCIQRLPSFTFFLIFFHDSKLRYSIVSVVLVQPQSEAASVSFLVAFIGSFCRNLEKNKTKNCSGLPSAGFFLSNQHESLTLWPSTELVGPVNIPWCTRHCLRPACDAFVCAHPLIHPSWGCDALCDGCAGAWTCTHTLTHSIMGAQQGWILMLLLPTHPPEIAATAIVAIIKPIMLWCVCVFSGGDCRLIPPNPCSVSVFFSHVWIHYNYPASLCFCQLTQEKQKWLEEKCTPS